MFLPVQSGVVAKRAERLLKELYGFFQRKATPEDVRMDKAWARLLVVLDIGLGAKQRVRPSADLLFQNTWDEMFFFPVNLRHVENGLLRCYEIAKEVWQVKREARPGEFEYRIYHSQTLEDAQDAENIEEFMRAFHNDDFRKPLP